MNKKTKLIAILMIILMVTNVSYASFVPYNTTAYEKQILNYDYFIFYKGGISSTSMIVINKDGVEYPAYSLYPALNDVRQYGPYNVEVGEKVGSWDIWRIAINGYPYKSPEELGCNNSTEAYIATQEAFFCVLHNKHKPNFEDYYSDNEDGKRIISAIKQIVNDATTSTQSPQYIDNEIKIEAVNTNWELDNIDNQFISKTYKVTSDNKYEDYTISINESMKELLKVVDLNNNPINKFSYNEQFKILVKIEDIQDLMEFEINAIASFDNNTVYYGYSTIQGNTDYIISGINDEVKTTLEDNVNKLLLNEEIISSIIKNEQAQIDTVQRLPVNKQEQTEETEKDATNQQIQNKETDKTANVQTCIELLKSLNQNSSSTNSQNSQVKKLPKTGM